MDMFSTLFLLATIVWFSESSVQTYKFNVNNVHMTVYGEILGVVTARGMIHCTVHCSEMEACRSVIFTTVDNACTMNRFAVVTPDMLLCTDGGCDASVTAKYASKYDETAPSVIQKACHETADCQETNVECTESICQCSSGFTYSESVGTCLHTHPCTDDSCDSGD